ILIVKNNPNDFKWLLDLKYFEFTEVAKRRILSLNPQDRFFDLIENQINFLVADLYSLTYDEFRILLEDFRVWKGQKGDLYIESLLNGYENYLMGKRPNLYAVS
ncbi:hypothetical protein, partial [Borrelia persica]|uniref:hypothetical protein n=1 Tax=Borrelia persica TaxID=44448 RepID=UPI0005713DD0